MSKILECFNTCPFVVNGVLRPCAVEISNHNPTCEQNIIIDNAFSVEMGVEVDVSIDFTMNHRVGVAKPKHVDLRTGISSGMEVFAFVFGGYISKI